MANSRTLARLAGTCVAAGIVLFGAGDFDAFAKKKKRRKKRRASVLTVQTMNVAGASGVPANEVIQVVFNQNVKPKTVNPSGAWHKIIVLRVNTALDGMPLDVDIRLRYCEVPGSDEQLKTNQVDASHTRRHAGTGLGLAICRELAEMLGASVSLVSEPGHGATFYVDLPPTYQPQQPQSLMGEQAGMRE